MNACLVNICGINEENIYERNEESHGKYVS